MRSVRRPYRVHLPLSMRKVAYATLAKAVRGCLEVDGTYIIEHREGGHWHPCEGVIVKRGAVEWRGSWEQLRERQRQEAAS